MPSTLFELKNMEMSGTLKRRLRAWRKQGKSSREIARLLSRSGVRVSRDPVEDWCKELKLTPNHGFPWALRGPKVTPDN